MFGTRDRRTMAPDGEGGGAGGEGNGAAGGGAGAGGNAGGALKYPWMAQLSPDMRGRLEPLGYDKPDALAKAHIEALDRAGDKGFFVPADDASDADKAAFRKAWGVPDKPDAYKLVPEGYDPASVDPAFVEAMGKAFHGANLNEKQATAVANGYIEMLVATQTRMGEEAKARRVAEEARLSAATGKNLDTTLAMANRVLGYARLGDDKGDTGAALEALAGAVGYDRAVLALSRLGDVLTGEGPAGKGGAPSFTAADPATAEAERKKLMATKGNILRDASHPEHATVKAQYDRLLDASMAA